MDHPPSFNLSYWNLRVNLANLAKQNFKQAPFHCSSFPGGSWSGEHGQSRELHWLAAHRGRQFVRSTGGKRSVQGPFYSRAQQLLQTIGCSGGRMPTEERKGMSNLDTSRTHDCMSSETNWPHSGWCKTVFIKHPENAHLIGHSR